MLHFVHDKQQRLGKTVLNRRLAWEENDVLKPFDLPDELRAKLNAALHETPEVRLAFLLRRPSDDEMAAKGLHPEDGVPTELLTLEIFNEDMLFPLLDQAALEGKLTLYKLIDNSSWATIE